MSNMSSEYRNNHYVPVWYQNKFIPSERQDKELYYLDLKPGFVDPRGVVHKNIDLRRLGHKRCFCQIRSLYDSFWCCEINED